jgi:hypothetical protein
MTDTPADTPAATPILVVVRDLLFASKIGATANALNVPIRIVRDPAKLSAETASRLIVDLNQEGALEAAATWKKSAEGRFVTGFVSHVDKPVIDRARQLGIDQILPRSQFVTMLPALLQEK